MSIERLQQVLGSMFGDFAPADSGGFRSVDETLFCSRVTDERWKKAQSVAQETLACDPSSTPVVLKMVFEKVREIGRDEGYSTKVAEINKEERKVVYEQVMRAIAHEDGESKSSPSDIVRDLATREGIALNSFYRKSDA